MGLLPLASQAEYSRLPALNREDADLDSASFAALSAKVLLDWEREKRGEEKRKKEVYTDIDREGYKVNREK